jgi:hypothetical protein
VGGDRLTRDPGIRVQISEVNLSAAETNPANQPTPQQRQQNHPILALEALIDELPDNEAQIAPLLFQLVRKGRFRSHEHIKDLEALFAAVRQCNEEEWERLSQMKTIFDEVTRDKSQISRLEDLVHHLDESHAEDARAILQVV